MTKLANKCSNRDDRFASVQKWGRNGLLLRPERLVTLAYVRVSEQVSGHCNKKDYVQEKNFEVNAMPLSSSLNICLSTFSL